MRAWVAASGGVRAIGDAGAVRIQTADWSDASGGPAPTDPDNTVTGTVSELGLPVQQATLTDETGREYDVGSGCVLDTGEYRLLCRVPADGSESGGRTPQSATVDTSVSFRGPARVLPDGSGLSVAFPEPTPVTLEFHDSRVSPATLTVPPTPEGVATALTHLSAGLQTTAPARSHPSFRGQPPQVETGEETTIPETVRAASPDTGIELQVPASLSYLFVGAPLAYYLGADVTVTEESVPRLVAPAVDFEYRFRELPTFQHGVTRLLRQSFFFDTLVRAVEDDPTDQQRRLAEKFGLAPKTLRQQSPAQRLARYFWVADADLPTFMPEWHFSTYVAPEAENVPCLSHLLETLSLVYLPEASELQEGELLERTLDDFYRSSSVGDAPVASVETVKPDLKAGNLHGWLAEGAPIDAFKTTPQAYRNRQRYDRRDDEELSVTVVLNDEEMADEHTAVADIYRKRSADLPLSVTVREHLRRSELAEVFTTPTDFVHYIGHCDTTGLQCPDGTLAAAELDTCRARTFFLNACGSYHEGLDLVERGSVAGAVTLEKVFDRQAAKVGTAFARLLVHGFGLEAAMQLSRRRIMMGKDYTVVGDGTYTLAPTSRSPTVGYLTDEGDGYRLRCETLSGRHAGGTYRPPFSAHAALQGTTTDRRFDESELCAVLRTEPLPVVYEGDFHWSDELAERLTRA